MRIAVIATGIWLALGLSAATAAEFTAPQKTEMGTIIRDYLMENPEVLRDALIELQRREQASAAEAQQAALVKNAKAMFQSPGDVVIGNPKGSVTLVEFFDYNCGYCKKSFTDIVKLSQSDKDLRIVLKEFPILSPGSVMAARAALAAHRQDKYWELHQAFMGFAGQKDEATVLAIAEQAGLNMEQLQKDMGAPEVNAVLAGNAALAKALGIEGTPAFVVDEKLIPGAVGLDQLTQLVEDVRKNGGCKLC
jgi:protein-disulfide isomerase